MSHHTPLIEQLNLFFAYMGKKLNMSYQDKEYLWKSLVVCQYMLSKDELNNVSEIKPNFFTQSLSIEQLSFIADEYSKQSLGIFASQLKEAFLSNAMIGAIPLKLQEGLIEFYTMKKQSTKSFSIQHITKIMHYTILSIIAMGIYYSYVTFGLLGLLGVTGFVGYWLLRKLTKKIIVKKEEKTILNEITKEIKKSNSVILPEAKKNLWQDSLNQIEISVSFSNELKKELEDIKKQILIFSKIYPNKENTNNLYMGQDIVKISHIHLPQLLIEFKEGKYDEKSLIATIETMNRVIQSHITELLWEDQKELAVKHRYWLNKLNENNQIIIAGKSM